MEWIQVLNFVCNAVRVALTIRDKVQKRRRDGEGE